MGEGAIPPTHPFRDVTSLAATIETKTLQLVSTKCDAIHFLETSNLAGTTRMEEKIKVVREGKRGKKHAAKYE